MCVCVFVSDRMVDWIKQGLEKVVPQPELRSKTESNEKTEAPAAPPKGTFSFSSVSDSRHHSTHLNSQ